MSPAQLVIGLDPGTSTGLAVWHCSQKKLMTVTSVPIHEAMDFVRTHHVAGLLASVVFEDARQRTWFGKTDARFERSGAGVREGVGSVKRDCVIWQDYLTALGVRFAAVKPVQGGTKWDSAMFARVTGWDGRTNEHGRDAALLIIGR